MIMDQSALAVAFAGMLPLMLYTIWIDMKRMLIPNVVCLAVVVIFVLTGSWGLPLDVFGWRLLHGVIVFFLAFLVFQIAGGQIGGGDLKLIAAITPFVPGQQAGYVLLLTGVLSLAVALGFLSLRWRLAGRDTGYKAFEQKMSLKVYVPMGVTLALVMIVFLGTNLFGVAPGM